MTQSGMYISTGLKYDLLQSTFHTDNRNYEPMGDSRIIYSKGIKRLWLRQVKIIEENGI